MRTMVRSTLVSKMPEPVKIALKQRLHYAELVMMLVKRELKVKYRGSILGYLWSMLNPLLFMVIISIVFSFLIKGIENYNLFVLSGILFWNMVTLTLNLGTTSIVRNAALLQKVRIPIWVFPLVPAGLGITNFLLSLVPYLCVFLWSGRAIPPQFWLAPVIFVLALVFLSGISLTLSTVNVFFRDVAHVLEPLLTLLFYATPVIFNRHGDNIPAKIKQLLGLNPFTHFIEAFRATIFGGDWISLQDFGVLVLLSGLSLSLGAWTYKSQKYKIIFNL